MLLSPTQSFTTVVDDEAVTEGGTRSPKTSRRATTDFNARVLLIRSSSIGNTCGSRRVLPSLIRPE
jgi:hypothetical protein